MRYAWKTAMFFLSTAFFAACASSPLRCPTGKQWDRTPITKSDQVSVNVQGRFSNDPQKFLTAQTEIRSGMTRSDCAALGFDAELKDQPPCDSVGWTDASNLILQGTFFSVSDVDKALREKMAYSGIRCRAYKQQVRTDRQFGYFSNRDTCVRSTDVTLTIIFKKDKDGVDRVVAENVNKNPNQNSNRQHSFGQIIGDIIIPPTINIPAPPIPVP
ncbi:MAG: hypothetical protein KGI60_03520 [Patescibacteria group bacterium]|nr:hypothetical protein [Patescibacteria group bacterium]